MIKVRNYTLGKLWVEYEYTKYLMAVLFMAKCIANKRICFILTCTLQITSTSLCIKFLEYNKKASTMFLPWQHSLSVYWSFLAFPLSYEQTQFLRTPNSPYLKPTR